MHSVADALGYNLDEHGVAVIDFQNNGNPGCFASLARALGYPWLIFVDGDTAGNEYLESLEERGFTSELKKRAFKLPSGHIEQQLVSDGLQDDLKVILKDIGVKNVDSMGDADLVAALVANKNSYPSLLASKCLSDVSLANKMPAAMLQAIIALKGLE